jgi:hypothetical protein
MGTPLRTFFECDFADAKMIDDCPESAKVGHPLLFAETPAAAALSCGRHGLAQAVGAERLDVVAAIEGGSVGDGAAAETTARFAQRGVLALFEPVAHVGQDAGDVVDAVDVKRGDHHGDAAAGHDALENIFGGMNAAGDADVEVDVTVEDCRPVETGQKLGGSGEVQRGTHFKGLDIEVGLIKAVEEHDARRAYGLEAGGKIRNTGEGLR